MQETNHRSGIWAAWLLSAAMTMPAAVPAAAQQATDAAEEATDQVTHVVAGDSSFGGARLHLPAEGTALTQGGLWVEGLFVGFVGDYIPFVFGSNEIRISDYDEPCHDESFFIVLDVQPDGIDVASKRLRSSCRVIVSWEDPTITLVESDPPHYAIALAEPVTQPIEAAGVAPAMASTVSYVRVAFESEPRGSEIYVNDEKLDFRTNARLSVPFMDDTETEKRWLIRQEGLVNCYGTIAVPARDATARCDHRDVR
jgi:hypothetical protein